MVVRGLKRSGILATVVALLLLVTGTVWAQPEAANQAGKPITVRINAKDVDLDEAPVLSSGRVFVPLRGVLERLGVSVDYDAGSQQIRLQRGDVKVILVINDSTILVNDEPLQLDVKPFIADGRTYIPLRFVAEVFGERVDWLPAERVVAIWSAYLRKTETASPSSRILPAGLTPVVSVSDEEFELLVRVINAEAFGEPLEGQVAVGAVIINRVLHKSDFPNTIKEVIYQPNQFMSVQNGQINREVAAIAYEAARAALAGEDPTGGALFFYNPNKSTSEFWQTRTVLIKIGNHAFAR